MSHETDERFEAQNGKEVQTKCGDCIPAYPYGTKVKLYKDGKLFDEGVVHDAGRGFIKKRDAWPQYFGKHFLWFDVWIESDDLNPQEMQAEIELPPKK